MLTQEKREANKARYIELIKSISLEGSNVEGFLNWLEKSDFFDAPASAKYHGSYPGGLCQHSLNVYDCLVQLAAKFATRMERNPYWTSELDETAGPQYIETPAYSDDSLKLIALLHDISKTNFYEQYDRNVKNDEGTWVKVKEYRTRDAKDRFVYGSHEQNSEFMAHTFFPLSVEEASAILHHHGGMSWDSAKDDIADVYSKFPLALLLHMADMTATFLCEGHDEFDN